MENNKTRKEGSSTILIKATRPYFAKEIHPGLIHCGPFTLGGQEPESKRRGKGRLSTTLTRAKRWNYTVGCNKSPPGSNSTRAIKF
jgi:hypothetical protein